MFEYFIVSQSFDWSFFCAYKNEYTFDIIYALERVIIWHIRHYIESIDHLILMK